MSSHVDIVSNEPLASEPRLIARIVLNGGPHLEMELKSGRATEDQMWRYLRSRVGADPAREPRAFLQELAVAIDSTYVGASDVHDDDNCPFRQNASGGLESLRVCGPLPG